MELKGIPSQRRAAPRAMDDMLAKKWVVALRKIEHNTSLLAAKQAADSDQDKP